MVEGHSSAAVPVAVLISAVHPAALVSAATRGPVTQQSDVFGVAVAGDNNDNPWTAACFVPGAVPDTPPPREMA